MTECFSGLDLGQASDFSAIVVVERTQRFVWTKPLYFYFVKYIHRWQLGTSYPTIVADLKAMYESPFLTGSTLAIDRTGVGRGVSDMVKASGIKAKCKPYSITAGSKPGDGTVPKKDLVAAVQVPLQEDRLKFAESLALTPILCTELEHFRVKVTADRNETFEAWREKDHDDLVLALALALYIGRNNGGLAFAFMSHGPDPIGNDDTFRKMM